MISPSCHSAPLSCIDYLPNETHGAPVDCDCHESALLAQNGTLIPGSDCTMFGIWIVTEHALDQSNQTDSDMVVLLSGPLEMSQIHNWFI